MRKPSIAEDRLNNTGPVTLKGKDWHATVPAQVAQDMKDGESLRRLREAVRPDMVETYGPHRDHGRFLVQVVEIPGSKRRASAEGLTLSEAAEACLEALAKR